MASGDRPDLSPAAVSRRLATLASLYRLARSLGKARIIGRAEEVTAPAPPAPDEPEGDGR